MRSNYTDEELEDLLEDLESDFAERKESWRGDAPDKGRQAVCAFANDLPCRSQPGVLFVGAADDGSPSGLAISDELLQTLAAIKTDGNILPPPTILVQKRILKGKELAIVIVHPADAPPVRYKGRVWIRIGSRRGIATAQDERILNEKRRHGDIPFDMYPVTRATVGDLNRLLFEQEYLPNAFAPDILASNDRSYEQRLASCGMVSAADDPIPTITGLLVLGKRPLDWIPGAYVQFLRLSGTKLSDPVSDERKIDGPLAQLLGRLDEKLISHNREQIDITSDNKERRSPQYPLAALQQLARNAVLHRTYEGTNSPVHLYWFDDRIEFISPGGPFGRVTAENFGQPGYIDYRNPHLADAMKVFGYVQRFGIGIQTAQAALMNNGYSPVEFIVDQSTVVCTVRRPN